ncbi:cyanophycin synthetase [Gloeobacter violaceus]|uniref:Cyanophycin synthetase n=1 Tax=Gloeobacter violaceus (strain ATCC 29082 / PCC 7421) TaxID=251221 RepID=Q7NDB0_GLOVI|nr:cyanophycin synthetase [Gloeobacter violaceus]BAC92267.1 cyanophycin synthetase [Gloeobacter violaceus PCC 7421]
MRILQTHALRGPNYWSIRRHNLIVMQLDLEELEEKPTNLIPGFDDRLLALMPSLMQHGCSEGRDGAFMERVTEGTWMGHVIEHVALELQTLAGMDVAFGRTRQTSTYGVYNVVFSYVEEAAGRYAARAAVRICRTLVAGEPYTELEQDIQELKEIREEVRFGPSTASIVEEAQTRGIPHIRLSEKSLVQLGYGIHQKRIQATTTTNTSIIATELASDKTATKGMLASVGIPVPRGTTVRRLADLEEAIEELGGYPVVLKPLDANHGKGITVDVRDLKTAQSAYDAAREFSKEVIVEQYITGKDYRILVINHQVVAVAERVPAHITGDGRQSIHELIDQVNRDPRRGFGHENVLTLITIDEMTQRILDLRGHTLDTVLAEGEICYLKSTANLSTGGTAIDRTDLLHPNNAFLAERVSRNIGLDICGIDLICPDISQPINEVGGAVIEVNAAPGFRMHIAPSEGLPRNVAEPVVDMLFPPGAKTRIPIIAVTGTNGKTTTTRLIAHILRGIGLRVGFTTTDGVYIQNQMVMKGDMTGPFSAKLVLKDPTVEAAVMETARGGILREGLGFPVCDIAVVLNVTADHLGLKGVETLEDLARVKSVVPESVHPDGFVVLNADDELVADMAHDAKAPVSYFSLDPQSPLIQDHVSRGGIAAVFEEGHVSILKGAWKLRVERVVNIPLTLSGRAVFMIQNVLAATLAAFLHGIKIDDIRAGLGSFVPSPAQTPGRLNVFDVNGFEVIVDYAHNPAGYEAIQQVLERMDNPRKIGVIGGPGDRRDEDLRKLGYLAAGMFDAAIVKEDDDRRGRAPDEAASLIVEGIKQRNPEFPFQTILDEAEAVEHALRNAACSDLVVIFPADVQRTIQIISRVKEESDPVRLP